MRYLAAVTQGYVGDYKPLADFFSDVIGRALRSETRDA